jgi:two-component system, OmpR family, response regulator VicR
MLIDMNSGTIKNQEEELTLTAKEYALLDKLYANKGNIVTIDALCRAAWDDNLFGYENTLMVHIRRLREKIEPEPSHPKYLLTVRGLGYKFVLEA